jgi:nicotinamidase-related amidase
MPERRDIRAVLFDLDGTFADTAPDLAYALNETLRRFGEAALPYERIRPHVSHGATALVRLGFGLEPGTEAFEFPKTVAIRDDDPKIVKNYGSAFKKTELDRMLKERGVNTVFLVGLSAVGCVLATYHGADDLDYKVFMVKHALISHDAALTKSVYDICANISLAP